MNVKQIQDAIIADIKAQFTEFDTVAVAETTKEANFRLPAFELQLTELTPINEFPDETMLKAGFTAHIIYDLSDKDTLMERIAGYIKYIDRNDWGINLTKAVFAGAEPVDFEPAQRDLCVYAVNFTHDFTV